MNKRLAYLCSSGSWGGLEMNQLRNAVWMKNRGHDVLIICSVGAPLAEAANAEGILVEQIGKHRKYYDFRAGKKLAEILDRHSVTHLIIRDTRDMSLSVIAKRKSKHRIHLSYFMEMQLGVPKKGWLHSIRFSYLDLWSCPLNWLSEQVRKMTKMDPARIRVIPSGLDLSRFSGRINREDARHTLDLPQDQVIVGLSGRFDPQKGQLLLLEATSSAQHKDFSVCFLGEPTKGEGMGYTEAIHDFIATNNLSDRVFIRPFRKDIEVFYKAIDVFVMASKAETFGMVTIEALASGTPVIASNSGGSPEILGKGRYGMLFEPLNAVSLADKIDLLLDKPPFEEKELQQAAQLYDHHKVCEEVEIALGLI